MPATPNIIDQLGTSWKLDVAAIATFSYQHPTFGLLSYSGDPDVPWLCDNVNTLKLTSKGTLPDGVLPEKVCIRPKFDSECGGGSYDLNPYNPPGDLCLCKDPGCDFTFPLYLTCNGVTDNCIGNFIRGTAETQCPATGPTYTANCTLNGVDMEVRMYCAGGTWMADIWNDGVLCDSCIPLTFEGCPFRITGTYDSTAPCANGCVPCIGPDCEPPPLDCCDLTGVPSLTADNNAGATITLSDVGGGEYTGTGSMDVPVTLRYSCSGTTPSLLVTFEPGSGCSGDPPISYTGTIIGCDPMEVDFAGVDLCGTTRTITVTE